MHQAPQRLTPYRAMPVALDAIEWEELPSLTMRHPAQPGTPAWSVTMPASLDALPQPTPFREPWHGLAVREVHEPEVFRHFFG